MTHAALDTFTDMFSWAAVSDGLKSECRQVLCAGLRKSQPAGLLRVIRLGLPILVRDLAPALGLQPFQLISELMQLGIFASMSQSLDKSVAVKIADQHGIALEILGADG